MRRVRIKITMSGRDGRAYTIPILEKPSYRNSGIIKAVTESGEKIQVARIDYESFENEEFQYIISPFWDIIDVIVAKSISGDSGN